MQYESFGAIKSKVERELDTEVEEFVQPEEFVGYVNDAISFAEAEIHKLGIEDEYFLTKSFLTLVAGEEDVSLPTNIYMNKIRNVVYKNGATIFEIKRIRGMNRFENIERINQYTSVTDYYTYLLRNDSAAGGVKMELMPPSSESSTQNVKLWYIREASKWNYATDPTGLLLCDMPQIAMQFLYQYVKYRVYEKEGHANMDSAKIDLVKIETTMIATMEQMVADDNTEIIKDLSIYEDFS